MLSAAQEIASLLSERMKQSGLEIQRWSRVPPLPEGWSYTLNGAQSSSHDCSQEPYVRLPLLLIVPIARIEEPYPFTDAEKPPHILYTEWFEPYWLVGAVLTHPHCGWPEKPFNAISPVESACIFAQLHPRFDSIHSLVNFGAWGHPHAQTILSSRTGKPVISQVGCGGYDHHAVFYKYRIALGNAPEMFESLEEPKPPSGT